MASSSSSPKPITSPTTSPIATRKPQPIPWTHQETVNLITAYQEKWYSLKRGPLRGSQWEEVAVIVAARCGYHFNYPSKSALQCRHKMEKLRQRHRSEKHRLAAGTSSTSSRYWQYFRLMDDLERGPQPISVRPLPHHHDEYNHGGDGGDDDELEKVNSSVKSRTRSINYILSQRPRTSTREDEIDDDEVEEEEEEEEEEEVIVKEKGFVLGLTAEIRGFAERIIGMENMKMEMMKETERFRLEMENKRIRMILDSQSRIVDSIQRAFGSS